MRRAAAGVSVFLALLACGACSARAEEVTICYNYGCYAKAQVSYGEAQLATLQQLFAPVGDAAAERKAIAAAIGRMYAIAGEQTPVWRDKGGNFADNGDNGQMDCIDHSTNTSTFLGLLRAHGWLKFHEVLEPVRRVRFLFAVHWAARIRETGVQQTYVVDSWYFDIGRPAVVIPLDDWNSGRIPDGA